MRREIQLILSMAFLMCPLARAQGQATPEALLASSLHPGVGSGDFEFFVDVAAVQPAETGQVRMRVLLQFPLRALLEDTDDNEADLGIQVRVYAAQEALEALASRLAASVSEGEAPDREEAGNRDQVVSEWMERLGDLPVQAKADTQTRLQSEDRKKLEETDYQVAQLFLDVPPGDHLFEIEVENRSRLKRGLLDKLRKQHRNASARMLVQVPDLAGQPALSDPLFLVGHGTYQDYATRVYGLLNDSLHVRCTLWNGAPTQVRFVATDREGEVHWRDSLAVTGAGAHNLTLHASVNTFPAGQYMLSVEARSDSQHVAARRSFDVVWSLDLWTKARRDLDFEAETVLTEKEYDHYESLPLGEKEHYMDAFWARYDPTPETAYNEVRAEYERRVATADARFSESIRGAATHRGKVFIRFGPPDEIQAEAVAGHLAGTGAEGLIEKVEDPYTTADEEILGPSGARETATFRSSPEKYHLVDEAQRVVGPARELMSYELWIYAGSGSPLLPRDVVGIDSGFRLLFLDTQGFGQYLLRKSSATLDIPGLHASY